MIFSVAALCLLALVIWLLIDPLRITLRAPDHGDPFLLRLRHTALKLDAWLGSDLSYGVIGHFIGLPFDTNTLMRAWRWHRSRPKTEKKTEPKPDADVKPSIPWAEVALSQRHRLLRAVRIDTLKVKLDYGTGDPVSTGWIGAMLWQLCAILPETAEIDAEAFFTEERFSIEGEARLEIFPWRVIVAAICLGVGGLTWRTRTAKASSSQDRRPRSSSPIPAAVPPPSPSSRS